MSLIIDIIVQQQIRPACPMIQVPMPAPLSVRFVDSELTISSGEFVYSLGGTFGPLVKNGTIQPNFVDVAIAYLA